MQWLELSPEEVAFLAAPAETSNGFATRLGGRLARTLSARLRLPVIFETRAAMPRAEYSTTPLWQVDNHLANVWLTRRLGGRDVIDVDAVRGDAAPIPPSCIHTLNAVLAESWLDAPETTLPPALAWEVTAGTTWGTLGLRLPHDTKDMTRWAREVIRHG